MSHMTTIMIIVDDNIVVVIVGVSKHVILSYSLYM